MRQLTAHPFMLPGFVEGLFTLQDVQILEEMHASNLSTNERAMLSTMRRMIQAHQNPKVVTEDVTVDVPVNVIEDDNEDVTENVSSKPLGSNNQGEEDNDECPPFVLSFRKLLRELADNSKWTEYNNRSLCYRCKDQPVDPWVTSCEHLFCYECLKSLDVGAQENGEMKSICWECGQYITSSHSCRGMKELDLHEDKTPNAAKTSRQRQKQKNQDEEIKWVNLDGKLLPSSKISAVQAQVEKWLQDDPGKKIILFSQFHLVSVYAAFWYPMNVLIRFAG